MAATQILVKTPITYDGADVVIENGQIQYTESIMAMAAKPILEKMNAKLSPNLKKIITNYEPEAEAEQEFEETVVVQKPTKHAKKATP